MSKTYRKDTSNFGKENYQKPPKRGRIRCEDYDPDWDQEENYERIRSKTRPPIPEQTQEDS